MFSVKVAHEWSIEREKKSRLQKKTCFYQKNIDGDLVGRIQTDSFTDLRLWKSTE